jgi:hypothetical protein
VAGGRGPDDERGELDGVDHAHVPDRRPGRDDGLQRPQHGRDGVPRLGNGDARPGADRAAVRPVDLPRRRRLHRLGSSEDVPDEQRHHGRDDRSGRHRLGDRRRLDDLLGGPEVDLSVLRHGDRPAEPRDVGIRDRGSAGRRRVAGRQPHRRRRVLAEVPDPAESGHPGLRRAAEPCGDPGRDADRHADRAVWDGQRTVPGDQVDRLGSGGRGGQEPGGGPHHRAPGQPARALAPTRR